TEVYVFCEKYAKTLKGNFYFLKINDQQIGWIEEELIVRIHDVSKFNPLRLYFKNKNNKILEKNSVENRINDDSDNSNEKVKVGKISSEVIPVSSQNFNIVSMGRLSPEKNFANLIEAFALFLKEVPRSTLFILGEGALRKELEELITRLNLQEHVFLLGHLENPFQFMKKSEFFVLPTKYEGQPIGL